MPTYVALIRLTDEGARTVDQSPGRMAAAIEKWEELGGKIVDVYAVMGEYDFVAIGEAPSDYVALAWGAAMAKSGTSRTVTMKAFDRYAWKWALEATPQQIREGSLPPERPARKP